MTEAFFSYHAACTHRRPPGIDRVPRVRPAKPTPSTPPARPTATVPQFNPSAGPAKCRACVCTSYTSLSPQASCRSKIATCDVLRGADTMSMPTVKITTCQFPRRALANTVRESVLSVLHSSRLTPNPPKTATLGPIRRITATCILAVVTTALSLLGHSREMLRQRLHFVHFRRLA